MEQEIEVWREELLRGAVARLRASIMAVVGASTGALSIGVATAWLLVRGGDPVGPHLALLSNYFPGYSVSWAGALLGGFYGAVLGGIVGFLLAWLYNRIAELRS